MKKKHACFNCGSDKQNDPALSYEWLRRSRTLLYDAYWPPFTPDLIYTAKKGLAVAKQLGANVIRFGSIGKWALYPSAIMPGHPELGKRDLLGDTVRLAHKNNIKVIAYIPVSHALPKVLVCKQKPQWAFLDDNRRPIEPIKHFGGPGVVPVCINGPYHQDILSIVEEIVSGYDVDGIYLDGPYQGWEHHGKICQCAKCKNDFRAETGYPLPLNAELSKIGRQNAAVWRVYQKWINAKLVETLAEIRHIVKQKKDVPLIINRTAMKVTGRDNESAMIGLVDGFLTETDAGGIEGFSCGAVSGKVVWNYTTQHRLWPRLSSLRLEKESALEAYRTIAMSATPIVSYAGRYFFDTAQPDHMRAAFRTIKKMEPILSGSTPVRHACVVFPTGRSRGFGARKKAEDSGDFHTLLRIHPDAHILYRCLQDGGIQSMVLSDHLLNDPAIISSFKIIAVPSTVPIGKRTAERFESFVAAGGTLLVSGSARDMFKERESHIMHLLGIKTRDRQSKAHGLLADLQWQGSAYDWYLQTSNALSGFRYRDTLMPQCEFFPVIPEKKCRVVAHSVCWSGAKRRFPSVFANKYGKGVCVYFNSPIERLLSEYGQVEFKEFVCRLLHMQTRTTPLYSISCPRVLQVTIAEKTGMYIAHIVNEENFGENISFSITVRLPDGARLTRAHSSAGSLPFVKAEKETVTVRNVRVSRYVCLWLSYQYARGGK